MKSNSIVVSGKRMASLDLDYRPPKPRTYRSATFKKYTSSQSFRLSDEDKQFFHHLGFIYIIKVDDILENFYPKYSQSTKVKRLKTLSDCGVLRCVNVFLGHNALYECYTLANDDIYKVVVGKKNRRDHQHSARDLMISKVYFAMGMPASLTLMEQYNNKLNYLFMTRKESECMKEHGFTKRPDALYVDNDDDIVIINTDHTGFSALQIQAKQETWKDFKQIWVFGNDSVHRHKKYADNVKYFYCVS